MVLLHQLEFIGLSVCFATFWGGLVFYLGSDVINGTARVCMSIFIVLGNTGFLLSATFYFSRELIKELRNNKDDVAANQILPTNDHPDGNAGSNDDTNDVNNGGENDVSVRVSAGLSADEQRLKELKLQKEIKKQERLNATKWKNRKRKEHARSTNKIFNDHVLHEKGFQEKTDKRQARSKRKTALRLQARIKLKDSKVLHEIPAFKMLKKEEVNVIIDAMDHIVR